jgi:formiminotetrahydrofolate cyclodeaminase
MIKDKPVQGFLDELASKSSTPGGGSVAAIMGAMGAALVSMVANLTVGKKNYEEVDAEMQDLLARSEQLREQLTAMIKADVDVFGQVMEAYGMPKESDEEKAARSMTIQSTLKAATDAPLECAKLCADIILLCKPMAEKGNTNVTSDAGVAVLAANAALRSAALNVYINISGIKDENFVNDRRKQTEALLDANSQLTEEIYDLVKSKL